MNNQKFPNGTLVEDIHPINKAFRFLVIDAEETNNGWRYKLGFPKKDGMPHKNRNYRFLYEERLRLVITAKNNVAII